MLTRKSLSANKCTHLVVASTNTLADPWIQALRMTLERGATVTHMGNGGRTSEHTSGNTISAVARSFPGECTDLSAGSTMMGSERLDQSFRSTIPISWD